MPESMMFVRLLAIFEELTRETGFPICRNCVKFFRKNVRFRFGFQAILAELLC